MATWTTADGGATFELNTLDDALRLLTKRDEALRRAREEIRRLQSEVAALRLQSCAHCKPIGGARLPLSGGRSNFYGAARGLSARHGRTHRPVFNVAMGLSMGPMWPMGSRRAAPDTRRALLAGCTAG